MKTNNLTLKQKIEIARQLLKGIKFLNKIMEAVNKVIQSEAKQESPNIIDANKRDPDTWS